MTGKIENNATGVLVLILPLAITIVVVLKAWPFLLLLMALVIIFKIWQGYQWRKWSQEVNPFFNQLIKENQGCLTPLDLSLKANLTAKAANRFLEQKAEEYGAQKKVYAEKGVVYYFLTASALGSIFSDSDNLFELEESEKSETPPQSSTSSDKFPKISTKEIADLGTEKQADPGEEIKTEAKIEVETQSISSPVEEVVRSTPSTVDSSLPEVVKIEETLPVKTEIATATPLPESVKIEETTEIVTATPLPESAKIEETLDESPPDQEESSDSQETQSSGPLALIQADLAKRLDINSSTVGRRKSDADFALWSQTKDPEGIAWKYVPKTKMFVPLDS